MEHAWLSWKCRERGVMSHVLAWRLQLTFDWPQLTPEERKVPSCLVPRKRGNWSGWWTSCIFSHIREDKWADTVLREERSHVEQGRGILGGGNSICRHPDLPVCKDPAWFPEQRPWPFSTQHRVWSATRQCLLNEYLEFQDFLHLWLSFYSSVQVTDIIECTFVGLEHI